MDQVKENGHRKQAIRASKSDFEAQHANLCANKDMEYNVIMLRCCVKKHYFFLLVWSF